MTTTNAELIATATAFKAAMSDANTDAPAPGSILDLWLRTADALEAALGSVPEASDDERETKLVADFRQHVFDAIQSGMFEDAGWSSEHYSKHFHVYLHAAERITESIFEDEAWFDILAARRSPVPADTPNERPWSESAWRKSDFVLVPSAEHTQMTAARPTPSQVVAALSDADLWDFADDLLAAWDIEDENPPSLSEQFRDMFVARFGKVAAAPADGETEWTTEPDATHLRYLRADSRLRSSLDLIREANSVRDLDGTGIVGRLADMLAGWLPIPESEEQ